MRAPATTCNWSGWTKVTTGPNAIEAATVYGIQFEVVKLAAAKKHGFVLLPQRWRGERDDERLLTTFASLHWIPFAGLLLGRPHFHSFGSS